jgi:hypothetical protein
VDLTFESRRMQEAIVLDATMTAAAVLRRLARHGLWLPGGNNEASAWIQATARRTGRDETEVEATRRRDLDAFVATIRRQWFANVLWYSRSTADVLRMCTTARPDALLGDVLGLHEYDSRLPSSLDTAHAAPPDSVVIDGSQPIGVGPILWEMMPAPPGRVSRGLQHAPPPAPPSAAPPISKPGVSTEPSPRDLHVWPRVDAPQYVTPRVPFEVLVGLNDTARPGVSGGEMVLVAPAGASTLALDVSLMADGVDVIGSWSQPLLVPLSTPAAADVRFTLVAREGWGPDPVKLTTIEVRYLRDGVIVGTAARPLVIGMEPTLNFPSDKGTPWLAAAPVMAPINLAPSAPIDLTIEMAKPDGNPASGVFSCWLRSPHPLSVASGPYQIDLGDDARTFAKGVIDEMRLYSTDGTLIPNLVDAFSDLIGEKLPVEAMAAIRDVAAITQPVPPSVLIVSADPYVPWELARMPNPIDPTRPPLLGAQVLLGRWLQDPQNRPRGDGVMRPPVQPLDTIAVRNMAVMAGIYKLISGLRALPQAEAEARTLASTYDAVPLPASRAAVKRLLDANLDHNFATIGGADAVHFAGHGAFDPSRPDSSVLLLDDGQPLSSILFRSARYGGSQQPLLFLNACMIGVGGQLLGDMGGFPGNCLRGGFGGVLGALWEVDDAAASEVALEFWRRALPKTGAGEPIGAILRDLRSKYEPKGPLPISTFLAYVYYGHPGLRLQRAS